MSFCHHHLSYFVVQVTLLFSQMFPELVEEKMEDERLFDAVNVILSLQVCVQNDI